MEPAADETRNEAEWRNTNNWLLGDLVYVSRRDSRMTVPARGDYQVDADSASKSRILNLGNWRTCALLLAVLAPLAFLLIAQRRTR